MIVNRRTYRILPGHWDQSMALAIHFRQLTRENLQRDYEILTPRYGPYRTICFEWHSVDEIDQKSFFHEKFYPMLEKADGLTEWFSHVDMADSFNFRTMRSSLPDYHPVSGSLPVEEEINQACRPGMLISRQFYLPITMGREDFRPAIIALQEETLIHFQREIRILSSYHAGNMSQLWVEFSYSDLEDQQRFEEAWQVHMSANGLLRKFDAEIGQGHNELWYSIP